MARKLMPKSGVMMPYVVANRDAQVAGVAYVDGKAGNIDLTGTYLKIVDAQTDYAKADKSYSKTESDNRYLQSHNIKIGYHIPIKAAGIPPTGEDSLEIDLIKADSFTTVLDTNGTGTPGTVTENNIIIGDLGSSINGVHIYSEGRTDVIYTNDGGELRSAPLYSQRYRPEIADMPFAAIGSYVKDAKGRTIGVDKSSGINSDIKRMQGLTEVTSSGVTFSSPIAIADGSADNEAVNIKQLRAAVAAGGGNSDAGKINGVLSNFLGAVDWWNGTSTTLPSGYLLASGQLVNRADYPDLWAAIDSKILSSVTDAKWLNSGEANEPASLRGNYSTGDGSTTFRMPDLNGEFAGSVGGLYLRGRNSAWATQAGGVRKSQAPNIIGGLATVVTGNFYLPTSAGTGALSSTGSPDNTLNNGFSGASTAKLPSGVAFNAFNSSPIYSGDPINGEIRPNSAYGYWIIRVSSGFKSSDTNFNVITGDATLPASGTSVTGGKVTSSYQVAGKDWTTASMVSYGTSGNTTKGVRLQIGDGSAVTKDWSFDDKGVITTPAKALNLSSGAALNVYSSDNNKIWGLKVNDTTRALDIITNDQATSNVVNLGGNAVTGVSQVGFLNKAAGYNTLHNAGISGNATQLIIPISATQGFCIQSGTSVIQLNVAGETTFSFPRAFAAATTFVVSNGDADVTGSDTVNSVDSWDLTAANVKIRARVFTPGQDAVSKPTNAYRINWVATGIVNL